MNLKKSLIFILIICLLCNLSFTAECFSVKLRGKIALAGVLSGVAFLTYTLVRRDTQAAERVKEQLGITEQIIQIERGFDQWEIFRSQERNYYFKNNRFIRKKVSNTFFLNQTPTDLGLQGIISWSVPMSSKSTDMTFSKNPKWSSLYPLPQLLSLQPATLYPRQLAVGHWHLSDQQH